MHKEQENFKKSCIMEGMTSIRPILEAMQISSSLNDRKIIKILFDESKAEKNAKELRYLSAMGKKLNFLVEPTSFETICAHAIGNTHRGILAECSERTIPSLLSCTDSICKNGFYAMIQGIEDPYNFGYALRSLYASGVNGIILPERNWMSAAGVVARASAGASERMPIFTADAVESVHFFHACGYRTVAGDVRTELLLPDADLKLPIYLIIGGEKRGISKQIFDLMDVVVKIPYGRDFSLALSAASATTIISYEILRQNMSH